MSRRSPPITSIVRDFRAKGDGVADEYAALQAAAAVNHAGGGILYFPPGVYKIDQYRISAGPQQNHVDDILFQGCDGLRIVGYGAKIDVMGGFHRGHDNKVQDASDGRPDVWQSFSDSVQPFRLINCRNCSIEGFELDGNVQQTTRDFDVNAPSPLVGEGNGIGIFTSGCSDYVIPNVYAHHFQCDGLYLGSDPDHLDGNATLVNVRSANNERQALTIKYLRGESAWAATSCTAA